MIRAISRRVITLAVLGGWVLSSSILTAEALNPTGSVGVENHADSIWCVGSSAFVTLAVDSGVNDAALKNYALKLATATLGNDASKPKQLYVLFTDKATGYRFKGTTINFEQIDGLTTDAALASFNIFPCKRATLTPASSIAGVPLGPEDRSHTATRFNFLDERSRAAARINDLDSKGVGTRPYADQLTAADEQYKSGQLDKARATLMTLDKYLKQQEEHLASTKAAKANQLAALPPNSKKALPMINIPGIPSISDFSGTQEELINQVEMAVIGQQLGPYMPNNGPFFVERLRIARRFRELDQAGVNIDSYRSFDRDRIESVVLAHDNKRMSELSENIKYLQRLLGLKALAPSVPR